MIIIFYQPQYFVQCGKATQLGSFPTTWIHRTYPDDVRNLPSHYRDIQKFLCQLNKVIPLEIWPPPNIIAPWDTWPIQHRSHYE